MARLRRRTVVSAYATAFLYRRAPRPAPVDEGDHQRELRDQG
jgi:hypothetical protein